MYHSRQCRYCLKDIHHSLDFYQLIYHSVLCSECIHSFEVIEDKKMWNGYSMQILYRYNDFFRSLLFQYKGQYDIALAPCFLDIFYHSLIKEYKDAIFVVLPSSATDNQKRGFCPNETILKEYGFFVFDGLYKDRDYKQTSQKDRSAIFKVLKMKEAHRLTNQKVVLFDDVITSGNSLKAALLLVEQCNPKSIEILVLSSK